MKYSSLIASALCIGGFCTDTLTVYDHQTLTVLPQVPSTRLTPMDYSNIAPAEVDFGKTQGQIIVSPSSTPPTTIIVVQQPRELNYNEMIGLADKWKAEAIQWEKDHPNWDHSHD